MTATPPSPAAAKPAAKAVNTAKAKPAAKAAAKTSKAPKVTVKAAAPSAPAPKPAKPVKPAASAKPSKASKPVKAAPASKPQADKAARKLVRDSFTMPQLDFALIDVLKKRLLAEQVSAKKSELLRAGLHALNALPSEVLRNVLEALLPIKTGRPKKGH